MSRIDELIAEFTPHGVKFKALGDIADLVRGNGMPKVDLTGEGVGAIHYGQIYTRYGVWTTETLSFVAPETAARLAKAAPGDIIITNTSENIEDVCKAVAWLGDETIVTGGHATVIKHHEDSKYLSYWFQSESFASQKKALATGTKVIDVSAKQLMKVRIPVPPLEVQREIVRILDQFTQLEALLEAELEAELEARKQQYEHYRTELLAGAATLGRPVELGELGRIVTGRTPKSSHSSAWGDYLDFVTPSDIKNGMKRIGSPARRLSVSGAEALSKAIVPENSLLVTCIGADMGKTVLNANACATNQQINSLTLSPGIDTDFVFHVLTSMRNKIRAQGERAGGTMPIINKSDFSKIRIALPPLEEQQRIGRILDRFDALVNDLSVGLPAEIAVRRKQYEYYRDKLLSFREAD